MATPEPPLEPPPPGSERPPWGCYVLVMSLAIIATLLIWEYWW